MNVAEMIEKEFRRRIGNEAYEILDKFVKEKEEREMKNIEVDEKKEERQK